jgi:hypothetical protein
VESSIRLDQTAGVDVGANWIWLESLRAHEPGRAVIGGREERALDGRGRWAA